MSPIERQHLLASGELIPIRQAAKHTPYSAEYLSLLARKGKITAVKLNRDWFTTPAIVKEYIEKQKAKHFAILQAFGAAESGGS